MLYVVNRLVIGSVSDLTQRQVGVDKDVPFIREGKSLELSARYFAYVLYDVTYY